MTEHEKVKEATWHQRTFMVYCVSAWWGWRIHLSWATLNQMLRVRFTVHQAWKRLCTWVIMCPQSH